VYSDQGTLVTTGRDGRQVTYHNPGDAADIVSFLERSNAAATDAQIAAYIDAKLAPERERRAKQDAILELRDQARRLEVDSPEQSISLYRESIQRWRAMLKTEPMFGWHYLEDTYNRLTLVLERSKQFREALNQISEYRAFFRQMGKEARLNTIEKRESRLRRRLLRSSRSPSPGEDVPGH
jgi:hypothetical protein